MSESEPISMSEEQYFDVSEMGNITLELVKRGYTEEQIRKIWGGNFMRVFKAVLNGAAKI
jgi:membrane dipeptidase